VFVVSSSFLEKRERPARPDTILIVADNPRGPPKQPGNGFKER
jgi:hypothetical protein